MYKDIRFFFMIFAIKFAVIDESTWIFMQIHECFKTLFIDLFIDFRELKKIKFRPNCNALKNLFFEGIVIIFPVWLSIYDYLLMKILKDKLISIFVSRNLLIFSI
jgi:hypothetical protein